MATDQDTTTAALGYEQARDELIDVVRRLEAGGATLEESLALWERGEELARVCRNWLEGARRRLDAVLAQDEEEEGAEGASDAAAEGGQDGAAENEGDRAARGED